MTRRRVYLEKAGLLAVVAGVYLVAVYLLDMSLAVTIAMGTPVGMVAGALLGRRHGRQGTRR